MLRASGRKSVDGIYQDCGRGIDYRHNGKKNAKAYFQEYVDDVNDEEAEQLAQAIVDCENHWDDINTLASWLLKISTSIETLRDTRSKVVDIDTFPFYRYGDKGDKGDKEAFRVLVMTHYLLISEQQGFAFVVLKDNNETLFSTTSEPAENTFYHLKSLSDSEMLYNDQEWHMERMDGYRQRLKSGERIARLVKDLRNDLRNTPGLDPAYKFSRSSTRKKDLVFISRVTQYLIALGIPHLVSAVYYKTLIISMINKYIIESLEGDTGQGNKHERLKESDATLDSLLRNTYKEAEDFKNTSAEIVGCASSSIYQYDDGESAQDLFRKQRTGGNGSNSDFTAIARENFRVLWEKYSLEEKTLNQLIGNCVGLYEKIEQYWEDKEYDKSFIQVYPVSEKQASIHTIQCGPYGKRLNFEGSVLDLIKKENRDHTSVNDYEQYRIRLASPGPKRLASIRMLAHENNIKLRVEKLSIKKGLHTFLFPFRLRGRYQHLL